MNKLEGLSIFFPCLNDGKSLSYLIPAAIRVARQFTDDLEVVIVNDGSTDNSRDILENIKKRYNCVKLIHHKKTLGYGGALINGFKNATKEWVFYTDGDGQYDVAELPKLIKKVNDGITTVVNGYKINREDTLLRKITGNIHNFILHIFFSLPVDDVSCDFRLIKKSLLDKCNLRMKSGAICLELVITLKQAGGSFAQAGVLHYKRFHGTSKFFNIKNIYETVRDNVKLYLSKNGKNMAGELI